MYDAAEECGYQDPSKVEKILNVSRRRAALYKQPEGPLSIHVRINDVFEIEIGLH